MKNQVIKFKSKLCLSIVFSVAEGEIFKVGLAANSNSGVAVNILRSQQDSHVEELIHAWLTQYLKGCEPRIELPLSLYTLPSYTSQVLAILRTVSFGKIISYQNLAVMTGKPHAARAVGTACSRNPCPLLVPCHRVIASNGTIGGYSGGMEVKRRLMTFEEAY